MNTSNILIIISIPAEGIKKLPVRPTFFFFFPSFLEEQNITIHAAPVWRLHVQLTHDKLLLSFTATE
jgi:hypothetical protein